MLAVVFAIVYVYTAILWVATLVVYSVFFESFDFGALTNFAWKSALLVGIVAAVATFVPYGGLLSLLIWALGLIVLFRKDLWECRILVFLIWGVNFGFGLLMRGVFMSMTQAKG